jgi:hypothetical protein
MRGPPRRVIFGERYAAAVKRQARLLAEARQRRDEKERAKAGARADITEGALRPEERAQASLTRAAAPAIAQAAPVPAMPVQEPRKRGHPSGLVPLEPEAEERIRRWVLEGDTRFITVLHQEIVDIYRGKNKKISGISLTTVRRHVAAISRPK